MTEEQKRKVQEIAQKYQVELLLLFGSQVTGKTHQESDYDLAYVGRRRLDLYERGQLMIDLASVFEIPLDKMELVPLRGSSPFFLKEVFTNANVLYAKDNVAFDRYKIYALRYFEESQSLMQHLASMVKKRAEKYRQELNLKPL